MDRNRPVIAFSHLRWDFVFQRPQQLLTRLAAQRPVVFVEEPLPAGNTAPRSECLARADGRVRVWRAHLPGTPGWDGVRLREMLRAWLEEHGLRDPIAWVYTPMAWPLVRRLPRSGVVYDCMDELALFLNAPRELIGREQAVLKAADVVFTGGPSLYRSKKDRHQNVHCFPSSVDVKHFGLARNGLLPPDDQRELARPRLGFFGVIDERLDTGLVDALAAAHPDWQIVLVGPVVKIDPASLPRRPNLHYLGQKDYQDLPAYLSGWDVCLLPFARNDATKFISPTKTLEYMAAERPIVSTPITDVAEPYSDIVYLGGTVAEFIAACEQALASSKPERAERAAKMRHVLARTSWDSTVSAMVEEVEKATRRKALPMPAAPVPRLQLATPPVVVVGAGPTGLSAAYHLGAQSLLLERNATVGGWCRSIQDRGFTFDHAGHIMFSKDDYVHQMYAMLLGDNVHWQDREAWIYSKGVYTRYPFQGALYGLPPEVIKECIVGAVEARFGKVKKNGSCQLNDCCADGIAESTAALGHRQDGSNGHDAEPANFEEFIYRVWGAGIAKHFAIPYNRKLWAVPLREMETSWLGGRVPLPDLEEMIEGALKPVPRAMGPNARFGYPLRGGFQALMNGFLPHLRGELRLNTAVVGVSPQARMLRLSTGEVISYDQLISTMPLKTLVRLMGDEAPAEVHQAAAALRHVSVRCVNLGVGREKLTEKHWIYYPEDTVFHRIFVQGNASPHCNPPGGFGLTCELTYSPSKPLPCDGDALTQLCIRDCHRVGILQSSDPVVMANQLDMPCAYVVYDQARAQNVATIRAWLETQGICLAGRYSEWEYYNSDHAFIAGKKAAEKVRGQRAAMRRMGVRDARWEAESELAA